MGEKDNKQLNKSIYAKIQEEVSVMKKKRSKKVVGWHVTLDNMSGKGSNQYKCPETRMNLVCLGD